MHAFYPFLALGLAATLTLAPLATTPSAAATAPSAVSQTPVRRIMVLPFRNLSQQPADAWLGESFSESLVTGLSELRSLRLLERAELQKLVQEQALMQSALADPENAPRLGRLVGAQYIVVGHYQRVGDRIQARARLVDIETGEIESASVAQVQGDFNQLFELQHALATQLVSKLRLQSPAGELQQLDQSFLATRSTHAHELYIQARTQFVDFPSEAQCSEAIVLLKQALAEDPGYAQAHALLASAYVQRIKMAKMAATLSRRDGEDATLAMSHARRAVELAPELGDAHHALAMAWQSAGQPVQALASAQAALERERTGSHLQLYIELKYPFERINSQPDVLEQIEADLLALGADFNDPHIQQLLASQYLYRFVQDPEGTDLKPAIAMLQAARLQRPQDASTAILLTALYQLTNQPAKAVAEVEAMLRIDPQNAFLRLMGAMQLRFLRPERAITLAAEALSLQPNLYHAAFLQAELLERQGDAAGALAILERLGAAQGGLAAVQYRLGVHHKRFKRIDEAMGHFERALLLGAQHPDQDFSTYPVLLRMAEVEQQRGHKAEAIRLYGEALASAGLAGGERSLMLENRARLLEEQGQYAAALKDVEELLRIAPLQAKEAETKWLYQTLYLQVQSAARPGEAKFLSELGTVYLQRERPLDALRALERARELAPAEAVIHYNLGLAYAQNKDPQAAAVAFSEALRLKPDYAKAAYSLGHLQLQQGNSADAARWLEQALALQPDYALALQALAVLREQQGQTAAAKTLWQRLQILEPANPDAAAALQRL